MFPRSTASNNMQAGGGATAANNGRRAFRDVTNANRSGGGKSKVAKRSSGVKTRSMSIASSNEVVILARQQAVASATAPSQPSLEASVAPVVREKTTLSRAAKKADPSSYQMTGSQDNIDERDQEDPLCTTAYVQDMYDLFRQKEKDTSIRPIYMESQTHINERMRAILIDWLVEVHLKFKLVPETLYLTVNLIDRYLERKEVSRPKLQLVGVTSLLIASKYEEIYPPELRDLVYICDRAYTRNDILEMEETILKALDYKVTIPSAHAFLVRYLKAAHADKKIVQLSCYILDGTLQSYNLLHYMPSQLAAAAVFISRRVVGRNGWSPTLLKYADYCEEEILPVARAMLSEKSSAHTELRAVNKKYSTSRYGNVSTTTLKMDF